MCWLRQAGKDVVFDGCRIWRLRGGKRLQLGFVLSRAALTVRIGCSSLELFDVLADCIDVFAHVLPVILSPEFQRLDQPAAGSPVRMDCRQTNLAAIVGYIESSAGRLVMV